MKPQHVFSALLVTAFVVLDGVLLVWLRLEEGSKAQGTLAAIAYGISIAEMILAASYWSLGRTNLIFRTIFLVAALFICATIPCMAHSDQVQQIFLFCICYLLLITFHRTYPTFHIFTR